MYEYNNQAKAIYFNRCNTIVEFLNSIDCLIKVICWAYYILKFLWNSLLGDLREGIVVKHGFYNNDNENRWLNGFETTNIATVYQKYMKYTSKLLCSKLLQILAYSSGQVENCR